ncbi:MULTISPECIES: DNA-directed RNA polymerase subunit beta [Paenibacillus]|uniref:DNA-directed RNA polymerase subunit beta n=1 Tax=Paenibacillus TaxID=44249 RepID=UPI00129E674F|nr:MULTISPECIES: DNA-directed RNA polymerase subunit beta [Paenibacillus]MCM3207924.1 DNA-directed RNA polymerase subunit beta [Paenibacillus illinoisensis]
MTDTQKQNSKPEEKEVKKKNKSGWRVARWFLIPVLLVLALAGGMVAGYVVLGKQDIGSVFQWSTWKHVYDLVFAS